MFRSNRRKAIAVLIIGGIMMTLFAGCGLLQKKYTVGKEIAASEITFIRFAHVSTSLLESYSFALSRTGEECTISGTWMEEGQCEPTDWMLLPVSDAEFEEVAVMLEGMTAAKERGASRAADGDTGYRIYLNWEGMPPRNYTIDPVPSEKVPELEAVFRSMIEAAISGK